MISRHTADRFKRRGLLLLMTQLHGMAQGGLSRKGAGSRLFFSPDPELAPPSCLSSDSASWSFGGVSLRALST